jgi:hypothetical protein
MATERERGPTMVPRWLSVVLLVGLVLVAVAIGFAVA